MACLWSELLDSGHLDDQNGMKNVHNVLDIIQHSLILLGNANELVSQLRKTNLLQAADKSLVRYGQEVPSQPGNFYLAQIS